MSADSSRPASISRRHLLTSAAGAGAAVAVAGVVGPAGSATVSATVSGTAAPSAGSAATGTGGPVVVHLRDVASGAMDVFIGTERIQIRDRALAERIARVAGPDQTTRSL